MIRLPSLFIVFLISVGLIGLVEYGVQKLPHAQKPAYTNIFHKRQTSTTIPGDYVPTTTPTTTPTTNTQGSGTPVTSTTINTVYVQPTPPQTTASVYVPSQSAPSGVYVPTTVSVTSEGATTLAAPTGSFVPTTVSEGYIATTVSGGYVATTSSVYVAVGQSITTSITVPTTRITSVASSLVTTDAAGQLTTITTYIPTTSTGLATIETVVAGKENSKGPEYQFPLWTVFVGNYLALVIVVVFKQFWTAIYAQAKLIEPFIRLAEGNGVPVSTVLSTFYLSSNLTPDPLLALSKRLWLVLWTSLAYFAVGFLAPLSSELLFLDTSYTGCPVTLNNPVNPCWPPRLSIDPIVSRVVQGLLTFIAIMTLTFMGMSFRMRTGIYSDPSSIGSIAALVHHPEVIEDFRTLSEEVSIKDINRLLGDKLYKLGEYQRQDGIWRYGLVPAVPTFQHYVRDGPPPHQNRPRSRRWKILGLFFDFLFLLVVLALLGIVVAYYLDGRDDPFNRFFNSHTFGPKFVLTGVGTLIAINWKRLERGKWKQLSVLWLCSHA